MASTMTLIFAKRSSPAWKFQYSSMGHRCSLGMNFSRLSFGGIAGPGLVSVLYPYAPPSFVSASQSTGGTYSYGPVIFTPDFPVTLVDCSLAEETDGFGHSRSLRMPRYKVSISGGGGLSLPYNHTNTLG